MTAPTRVLKPVCPRCAHTGTPLALIFYCPRSTPRLSSGGGGNRTGVLANRVVGLQLVTVGKCGLTSTEAKIHSWLALIKIGCFGSYSGRKAGAQSRTRTPVMSG